MSAGDLILEIPDDLARRAEQIISRYANCDPRDFKFAMLDQLGDPILGPAVAKQAACAARAVVVNAANRGPLQGFDLMQIPHVNFQDAEIVAKLLEAREWAREVATAIGLPVEQADALAFLGVVLGGMFFHPGKPKKRFLLLRYRSQADHSPPTVIHALGKTVQHWNTLSGYLLNQATPTVGITAAPTMARPTAARPTSTSRSNSCGPCVVQCSQLGLAMGGCETACPSCTRTKAGTPEHTTVTTRPLAVPTAIPTFATREGGFVKVEPVYVCEGEETEGFREEGASEETAEANYADAPVIKELAAKHFCPKVESGPTVAWVQDVNLLFSHSLPAGKGKPGDKVCLRSFSFLYRPRDPYLGQRCLKTCTEVFQNFFPDVCKCCRAHPGSRPDSHTPSFPFETNTATQAESLTIRVTTRCTPSAKLMSCAANTHIKLKNWNVDEPMK